MHHCKLQYWWVSLLLCSCPIFEQKWDGFLLHCACGTCPWLLTHKANSPLKCRIPRRLVFILSFLFVHVIFNGCVCSKPDCTTNTCHKWSCPFWFSMCPFNFVLFTALNSQVMHPAANRALCPAARLIPRLVPAISLKKHCVVPKKNSHEGNTILEYLCIPWVKSRCNSVSLVRKRGSLPLQNHLTFY